MKIGDRPIGPGHPVYVIAEIGGNHDGNLDQAKTLIRAAAHAGADAAKFQLFRPRELYPGKVTPGSIPDEWLPLLQDACYIEGIEFLCSVFSLETLEAYMRVDPPAVKIASPEATNLELLRGAGASSVPVIVSTGAMTWEQVRLVKRECVELVLLHCVSAYPAPPEQMNLAVIRQMIERYDLPVGLSDHTLDSSFGPVLAVACGACMIEKHLTLDRSLSGADHSFALEPDGFRVMVADVRAASVMLGDGVKRVMPSEDPTDRRAA